MVVDIYIPVILEMRKIIVPFQRYVLTEILHCHHELQLQQSVLRHILLAWEYWWIIPVKGYDCCLNESWKNIGLSITRNRFSHALPLHCCPAASWNFLICCFPLHKPNLTRKYRPSKQVACFTATSSLSVRATVSQDRTRLEDIYILCIRTK